MKKGNKVTLKVTDRQLALIQNALEEHFRLRMGQVNINGLADDLCFQNVRLDRNSEDYHQQFDACIERRDRAMYKLIEFMAICSDGDWKRFRKTPDVQIEIDMWNMIRHWFWHDRDPSNRGSGVDSYQVYQFGSEPLPEIKREEHK